MNNNTNVFPSRLNEAYQHGRPNSNKHFGRDIRLDVQPDYSEMIAIRKQFAFKDTEHEDLYMDKYPCQSRMIYFPQAHIVEPCNKFGVKYGESTDPTMIYKPAGMFGQLHPQPNPYPVPTTSYQKVFYNTGAS